MPPSSHIPVAYTPPSSRVTTGLWVLSPPRPDGNASYALRVPRAGTLRTASFRFHLTVDTLAVRLTIPITRARRGLAPPSVPLRHHTSIESACCGSCHAWHTKRGFHPGCYDKCQHLFSAEAFLPSFSYGCFQSIVSSSLMALYGPSLVYDANNTFRRPWPKCEF